MRAILASILLLACIIPAHAQQQSDRDRLRAGVWERILARLEALPARWDALPTPAVLPSGRLPPEVLEEATETEHRAALRFISDIVAAPPEKRARIIGQARQRRVLSEVDLWFPLHRVEREGISDPEAAGLTLDAWLELAEHLGRRDVLLGAAGFGIALARHLDIPLVRLAAVTKQWSTLPPGPHGAWGAASVSQEHGRILFNTGRHHESIEAYRRARQLYRTVGDQFGQGYAWHGEADVLFRLGHNDDALAAYRQARSLSSVVKDRIGQGNTWVGEGQVLFRLGHNDEALAAYHQARSLFSSAGDRQGQANTWLCEARLLFQLDHSDHALVAYRQARSLFSSVGHRLGEGNTWVGEAQVLFRLGHTSAALTAYRRARALFSSIGDQLGEGTTWVREADILLLLGHHEDALAAERQARALFSSAGAQENQGITWLGEASIFNLLGQTNDALTAYRQARSLFSAVGNKEGQGVAWGGEADILLRLGHNDGALTAYRQARVLHSSVGNRLNEGLSWLGEADVFFQLGELDLALRAAENAARFAKDVGDIPNELKARMRETFILLARKQEHRAIQRTEDAFMLLRRWRQKGVSDLDRTAMSNWSWPYDVSIPLLARKGGPAVEKALALAEEAHAPVLLDLLATGSRRPQDTGDRSLREERKNLQQAHAKLDQELAGAIEPGTRQKLQRERETLDAHLELNELAALGSLKSTFVNGTPIDASARNTLVEAVGPILLYYIAENETVAFLLQPGQRTPLVRFIGLSKSQLQRDVQALRHALSNPAWEARARERQRALFDQLVAPFADGLAGTPRLTIIPHGPLHELPFEALLVDDKTPLFERWHVSIAPSLSVLNTLRQRRANRKPTPGELAFLGIAGGTGLSLTGPTVEDVGAEFGPAVQIVSPGPGSHPAYLEHAPRARHLLVATHGTHVAHSRSGHLELTAAEGHATRLTASEIAHNPLRAELVTLAACETARGEAMLSDERLDLTRAFLIAGADAVLATRWKVPEDESTRQFLLDFYQALRQGGPGGKGLRKDEALTEARRRARERKDDAQLWAAWVLVGDAR
jgi:CHAT domain-containing protein/tetratricopeptide (TPR) repeat protein